MIAKLPITDGESGPHCKRPVHNVVHVNDYPTWPPLAGDKQGINYLGWLGTSLCKHENTTTFFRVCYDHRKPFNDGIHSYKGVVCKECGKITWEYRDL